MSKINISLSDFLQVLCFVFDYNTVEGHGNKLKMKAMNTSDYKREYRPAYRGLVVLVAIGIVFATANYC